MAGRRVAPLILPLLLWRCLFLQVGEPQFVHEFAALNERPIVGIAAQETRSDRKTSAHGDTYISATYVQYLQQAGARVVAVRAGEPLPYYTDLFSKLNGLLFPGGTVSLTTSQYARTGRIAYKYALEAFDKGDIFPLWGTCLGFELLNNLTAGQNLLQDVDAQNMTLPLEFTPGYMESRMFGKAPEDVLHYLRNEPVTQNEHRYGILLDVFKNNAKLRNFYHVLSTNVGRQGERFVSTFEGGKYPIYGTQWHPEKNAFNWNPHYVINHSQHAVRVAQYTANFFVGETRKSTHRFSSSKEESAVLINNVSPVYFDDGTFYEKYYFNFTNPALHKPRWQQRLGLRAKS